MAEPKKAEKVYISIYIDADLRAKLKKRAEKEKRGLSNLITLLLERSA